VGEIITQFPKLSNREKVEILITRYKQKGKDRITASIVAKHANLVSGVTAAHLLRQSDKVKYNGKEWVIL
jgi:hypothetical protein